jgi:hypothetical protein
MSTLHNKFLILEFLFGILVKRTLLTFDILHTALVATLDTYDFIKLNK